MSQSWLQRQRKQALLDLSTQAGLPQDEELRKDEIIEKLSDHLQKNATTLASVPGLEDYYGKRRSTPGRPARESTAANTSAGDIVEEVKSVVKKGGKKATQVKQEIEEAAPMSSPSAAIQATIGSAKSAITSVTSALSPSGQLTTMRTPATTRAPYRRRSEIPGPPSPADVADLAEHESEKFVEGVTKIYQASHISENIESLRQICSSVTAVQISFLLLEAFALQRHTMPWKFLADVPSTPLTPSYAVHYPDLFILLTGYYWSTTLLWAHTSIFIPVLFAYFYNLTLRDVKRGNVKVTVARYTADPLVYNIVKALATYIIYGRGVTFGLFSPVIADRVDVAMYGGYTSVLIGSGVGALAALYEAAQKKHL